MAKQKVPYKSQKQTLADKLTELGIPKDKHPSYPYTRLRLIKYIERGNGVIPTGTAASRAKFYVEEYEKFVGKTIIDKRYEGDTGQTCTGLFAKSTADVKSERGWKGRSVDNAAPIYPFFICCGRRHYLYENVLTTD